jgi:hypothetical protein
MPYQRRMITVILLYICVVTPVSAVVSHGDESIQVKLSQQAKVLDGGQAVHVLVQIRCAPDTGYLLESLVYVVQDDQTSHLAPIPVRCDGRWQRNVIRVAASSEHLFHPGPAHASAYVLMAHPTSAATASGSDTRRMHLR